MIKVRTRVGKKLLPYRKHDDKIKGISLKKNAGQDNAIMAGLSQVTGEYVVIMDDDLQHRRRISLKLYEKCKQGYDICYSYFVRQKTKSLEK